MKQVTLIEVVGGDGLAIIAIGRSVMIAASAHALVLYVAGTTSRSRQTQWICAGHHRPFRTEAPMSEIIHEARAWIEELEVASVHRLAS